MADVDPRRLIPRTDQLLALPQARGAVTWTSTRSSRRCWPPWRRTSRPRCSPCSMRPVWSSTPTSVVRPCRPPPSRRSSRPVATSTSSWNLATGTRSRSGAAARAALLASCPAAEDALVVTLAALEATLLGGPPPVIRALHADPDRLQERAERLGEAVGAPVVVHDGRVGLGGPPVFRCRDGRCGSRRRLPPGCAPVTRWCSPACTKEAAWWTRAAYLSPRTNVSSPR